MAPARSKRQSRKRRKPRGARRDGIAAEQDEITPERIQAEITRQRAAREAQKAASAEARARREPSEQGPIAITLTGKTYGEPPPNLFGGVPVSEVAIVAGVVGIIVGWSASAAPALITGVIVCTLGVLEFTLREHFSGYRSHATLLAAIPAVAVGIALVGLDGASLTRGVLFPVVLAIFAILFFLLRKRFGRARQTRVARPPAP